MVHFILPVEKAATYDLSLNISLIVMCTFVYLISISLVHVTYDKANNKLFAKNLYKEVAINISSIVKIENIFPSKCKITYSHEGIKKSIVFIPRIVYGNVFSGGANKIKRLLKNS